eukprot:scaffold1845_cov174-Amphora_coffeaeformis.AAC.3
MIAQGAVPAAPAASLPIGGDGYPNGRGFQVSPNWTETANAAVGIVLAASRQRKIRSTNDNKIFYAAPNASKGDRISNERGLLQPPSTLTVETPVVRFALIFNGKNPALFRRHVLNKAFVARVFEYFNTWVPLNQTLMFA